jgi:hypothetical protein
VSRGGEFSEDGQPAPEISWTTESAGIVTEQFTATAAPTDSDA